MKNFIRLLVLINAFVASGALWFILRGNLPGVALLGLLVMFVTATVASFLFIGLLNKLNS